MRSADPPRAGAWTARKVTGVILSTHNDQYKVMAEVQGPFLEKGLTLPTVVSEHLWDKSRDSWLGRGELCFLSY